MTQPSTFGVRQASKGRLRATIADVARMAGVAPMTVSRVLTGAAAVRPEKVHRIQEAIQLLQYKPNETARALRSQRSKTIGLIVPRLSDPFFATIAILEHHPSNDSRRRRQMIPGLRPSTPTVCRQWKRFIL